MKRILILVGSVLLGIALIVCGWWFFVRETPTAQPEDTNWSELY